MIDWTIVTSIVVGLSLFELCKAIANYWLCYIVMKRRWIR